ncbi:Bug family tripartite tricarboxylate transporter substrate binding protein [Cupriavidus sp. 2MCAB6]|uniref:Bug family tripartite tricarboxylate transporter substrate binding protein n=1 Tax=Cupriavidus sp. 2MCAB6 TaxID=3232981 RepID=UPI003F8FCD04
MMLLPTSMRQLYICALLVGGILTNAPAHADSFPERPVHLVVPFSPGGLSDSIARMIADKLRLRLGQPVVIENRPGGSTLIGAEHVAKAPPDGYTLLLGSSTTFSMLPALRPRLPIAAEDTWAPVAIVGETSIVVSTRAENATIESFASLLAQARARPGAVTYGTTGPGTAPHLVGAMIASTFQVDMTPVAYRGSMQVLADVIGGQIDLSLDPFAVAKPLIDAGRLKPLAISSAARLPQYSAVPTFSEVGVTMSSGAFWYGIAAPRGTPQNVLGRLRVELQTVLQNPEFQNTLAERAIFVGHGRAEDFRQRVRAEIAQYRQLARDARIKLD